MTVFHIILLGLSMLFMHVFDDYHLQGILASMKQKKWWQDNYPDEKYKNDYKVALICHAFSWSFMIHLPITITYLYLGITDTTTVILFTVDIILQTFIHAIVDNAKANNLFINLVQDQIIHLLQILITYGCFVLGEFLA